MDTNDRKRIVVSTVSGFLGFRTLCAVIDAGIDVVDIALFPQDRFELDSPAKEHGVRAIVDCGVAPGVSNLLVGHADSLVKRTETVAIYVGGLGLGDTDVSALEDERSRPSS